jgi:RimJ/RimL family protein N-acetyltransferase
MEAPLIQVVCNEPEGNVVRNVYPMLWTPENIEKLTSKVLEFPTLYGREIKSPADITEMFLNPSPSGITAKGLFFVVDDFVGLFYITDFAYNFTDAIAHYTFFDRRHRGRIPLVRAMMKYVFETYQFNRLSVEVPLFTSPHTRHFIGECGFTLEGKKRKSIRFKDDIFDILLFGILKSEVLKSSGKP